MNFPFFLFSIVVVGILMFLFVYLVIFVCFQVLLGTLGSGFLWF